MQVRQQRCGVELAPGPVGVRWSTAGASPEHCIVGVTSSFEWTGRGSHWGKRPGLQGSRPGVLQHGIAVCPDLS